MNYKEIKEQLDNDAYMCLLYPNPKSISGRDVLASQSISNGVYSFLKNRKDPAEIIQSLQEYYKKRKLKLMNKPNRKTLKTILI